MTALVIVLMLVIAGMGWALWAQRREIERLQDALSYERSLQLWMIDPRHKNALTAIADATRDGKSGTARKINRMAKEALK